MGDNRAKFTFADKINRPTMADGVVSDGVGNRTRRVGESGRMAVATVHY